MFGDENKHKTIPMRIMVIEHRLEITAFGKIALACGARSRRESDRDVK